MNTRKKANLRLKIRMLHTLSFLCAVLFLYGVTASAALKDFDHFDTGFPLTGKHNNTACDSCHINGVFKGTPKECGACHNEQIAVGKNKTHIESTDDCDDCHTTFNFSKATVDHGAVIGQCQDCHEQPRDHIRTNAPCDDCHNTVNWTIVHFDHSGITQGCVECHSKSRGHPETGDECDLCHRTNAWLPVFAFDHTNISSTCKECHMSAYNNATDSDCHDGDHACEKCHEPPPAGARGYSLWTTLSQPCN